MMPRINPVQIPTMFSPYQSSAMPSYQQSSGGFVRFEGARNPAWTSQQMLRALRRLGFHIEGGGKHVLASKGGVKFPVPVHSGNMANGTQSAIAKRVKSMGLDLYG